MNTQNQEPKDPTAVEVQVPTPPVEVQVEIRDDTPEPDRNRPARDPAAPLPDEYANDEELKQYSESVRSRIGKLKFDYHDQKRAREKAERERDEAIRYALGVLAQTQQFQKVAESAGKLAQDETKARVSSQMEILKAQYADALERSDHTKAAEVNKLMAILAADMQRAEALNFTAPEIPPPPQPQPVRQPASPQAQSWAEKNSWFGKDQDKTRFAMAVHMNLLASGVQPDSEEYYREIDSSVAAWDLRKEPQPRQARQTQQSVPVAPVTRTSGPQRVQLTQSQVDVARRLGISLEDYAKEVLRLGVGHA